MLLSLSAQLIESIAVRALIYTVEASSKIIYWTGQSLVGMVFPPAAPVPSAEEEMEQMKEELRELRSYVEVIKQRTEPSQNEDSCTSED